MPVGFGKRAMKSKGLPLSVMARIKASVVEVKAIENRLSHALIIPIAEAKINLDYKANRQGRKILTVVRSLLATTGIDLSGGGESPN